MLSAYSLSGCFMDIEYVILSCLVVRMPASVLEAVCIFLKHPMGFVIRFMYR